jgi:glycosidase
MQWSAGENAGFSKAKPWLGINANYRYINYEFQKNDPASILNFYKNLIALRQRTECLKSGEFAPLYADDRLMLYQRTLENEIYTIALNFSSRTIKLPQKTAGFLSGVPLISTADRTAVEGKLLPWEGVLGKSET